MSAWLKSASGPQESCWHLPRSRPQALPAKSPDLKWISSPGIEANACSLLWS
jgi:hypothetical protein